MNSGLVLGLMSFLFLFFGYLGVPVPFALMAGVLVGASFTQVSHIAIIQKMFDGMDAEALLAIPFFLLVGELMSSANVVVRIVNLSLALVVISVAVSPRSSPCSVCFSRKCPDPRRPMSQ